MTEPPPTEMQAWSRRLDEAIGRLDGPFRRAIVLADTASTQDAALAAGGRAGDVVVAWRQTAGRGRLGRRWHDEGGLGLAVTFVLDAAPSTRLPVAVAVGVARAVEGFTGRPVGLKWPNDVMVDGRKLAGILVEQRSGVLLLGIGLNVGQPPWPPTLEGTAVSLRELGADVAPIEVLLALIPVLAETLDWPEPRISEEFRRRDVLVGTVATVAAPGGPRTGRVVRIDPLRGLALEGDAGEIWLPAATTTIVSWAGGSG